MPMAFETEPFNGDHYIGERIRQLVAKHHVLTIVETGTYQGVTTRELARIAPRVFTIENNEHLFQQAKLQVLQLAIPSWVRMLYGDSQKVIREMNLSCPDGRPPLLYLDAHWGADWPLLGELAAIAEAGIKPVIVIHDFEVPGADLGYDEYGGQRLNWEYVREAVERIYGADGYTRSTNDPERAAGARRGVLYLEPKV